VEKAVASEYGSESDVDPPAEMDELRAAAKNYYYQDVNEPTIAVPAGMDTPVEILDSLTRSGNPFRPSRDLPRDAQLAFAFNALLEYERLPRTYAEAKSSPDWKHWREAIVRELTAIRNNNTWITIKNYLGARKLPYKWVFTRKYDEHGNPTVYKARLVIGGHKQVADVDYDEIYASVARTQTIRVFLAYATIHDWSVFQMDYNNAFLNGNIDTKIHMRPPTGLDLIGVTISDDELIESKKALYGLKQAPRLWKLTIDRMMMSLGFKQSGTDTAVYFKDGCVMCVYVDDLLIMVRDESMWPDIEQGLKKSYQAKSLGKLTHYLGMVWKRDRNTRRSWLNQTVFCSKVLKKFDMENCKPVAVPISPDFRVSGGDTELFSNVKLYQSAVGSLIYLSIGTRPDISFAVNVVSRAMAKPSNGHWAIVKGIFRYLNGTRTFSIQYGTCDTLVGYADADWGMDLETRRSTTGFVFMMGGPISWQSRLQKVVALSSMEAEYYSLVAEIQDGIWITSLLNEVGFKVKTPVILKEDN
jgi:hypothetical protein